MRTQFRTTTILGSSGLAVAMVLGSTGAIAQEYNILNLTNFRPNGLSSIGPVVAGQIVNEAAIWEEAGETLLGTLEGGIGSLAYDVNNLRQVVGLSYVNGTENMRAFLWEDGVMADLGGLNTELWSEARALNDEGNVVGHAQFSIDDETGRAFFFADGEMTDLGVLPGGTQSIAVDVNALGEVAGSGDVEGGLLHAFLWQGDDLIDLGVLGEGGESSATGMNDAGQIVGWSTLGEGLGKRAFLFEEGMMMDLGTLPLSDESSANDINADGTVVGYVIKRSGAQRAAIWRDGILTDLNMLIPGCAGWTLEEALAINGEGHIACIGRINGNLRGCLLIPADGNEFDLVLEGPIPGFAGMLNTLRVSGAQPGERIFFAYSSQPGCKSVRQCPGLYIGMDTPVVDSAFADDNGVAELSVYITSGASGRTGLVRAIEGSSCRTSKQVAHTFP